VVCADRIETTRNAQREYCSRRFDQDVSPDQPDRRFFLTTDPDFIRWDGHRIRVMQAGDGYPLLLMAGLGCSSEMWAPFAEQFPGRRLIIYDAPGTGCSSIPLYPVSVPALARLATAVLDHFGIDQADVLGVSYGGAVAQQLACDHADRVRKLVLAAATCGVGAIAGSFSAMRALSTPLRFYSRDYFDSVAAILYGGATARDEGARARDAAARSRNPPSPYGYAMQLMGASGWSSLPFLERIRHETLVICGDDDPLVPVANAQLLARCIPRARLEIVERAGHLFLWDDPANAAARIRLFVDGHPDDKYRRSSSPKRREALRCHADVAAHSQPVSYPRHLN